MSKIMVERPRWGSRDARRHQRKRRYRDLEDAPLRGPRTDEKTKSLSENFGPFLRFLESRTGSKWDDVYSEISKNLRPTNAVQQHVRDHLEHFVERHVIFVDGRPRERIRGYEVTGFYVCPNTGLLCSQQSVSHKRRKPWVQYKRGCRCVDCRALPKVR